MQVRYTHTISSSNRVKSLHVKNDQHTYNSKPLVLIVRIIMW